MITMRTVGDAISELDIRRLEKKIQFSLPDSYREFVLKYNGGRPTLKYFPLAERPEDPIGQVLDFYGVTDAIESCRLDWNFEVFLGRMPRGFLPIACEDGGNIICLSLVGETKGKIFYWDHDRETQPASFENVYKIADSFEAFVASLYHIDVSELLGKK